MNELIITKNMENQRLDKFLLKYFNKAGKNFIYKMLRKKRIKLNNQRAEGCEILQAGDCLKFFLSQETMQSFMSERKIKHYDRAGKDLLDIIYEDANILICSKPAGLLTHSQASDGDDTLVDRILVYLYEKHQFCPTKESSFTPAVCNRLDRNTSGIVICGKTLAAIKELSSILAERKADKLYSAIVFGEVKEKVLLKGYHAKDSVTNKASISIEDKLGKPESAKEVLTEYWPVKTNRRFTLLELKLITGKTHQIRAHLSSVGHDILGDRKYGNIMRNKSHSITSQMLHAHKFIFRKNSGLFSYLENREFIAPYPLQFEKVLIQIFGKI